MDLRHLMQALQKLLKKAGVDAQGRPHYRALVWDSRTHSLPALPVPSATDTLESLRLWLTNAANMQEQARRVQEQLEQAQRQEHRRAELLSALQRVCGKVPARLLEQAPDPDDLWLRVHVIYHTGPDTPLFETTPALRRWMRTCVRLLRSHFGRGSLCEVALVRAVGCWQIWGRHPQRNVTPDVDPT